MWSPSFRDTWVNVYDSPQDVLTFDNVFVDMKTGLVIKDGQVVWSAAVENLIWLDSWITASPNWKNSISRMELVVSRMKNIQNYADNISYAEAFELEKGDYLHFLHPFGRYVYGHLFDTFQKISAVAKRDFQGVIISDQREVVDFSDHLLAAGINKENVISQSVGSLIFVPSLTFVRPLSHPTNFTVASYEFVRQNYFNYFNGPANSLGRKIFLTRRKGSYRRYLINSDEVESRLNDMGVDIYDGSESLSTLFQAFASASHVSGVHGALFVNNIFSYESCRYLEFCPVKRPVTTFHDQYKRAKVYEHYLNDCDDEFNISIDLNKLMHFYAS